MRPILAVDHKRVQEGLSTISKRTITPKKEQARPCNFTAGPVPLANSGEFTFFS
jgi:hypothetical protein